MRPFRFLAAASAALLVLLAGCGGGGNSNEDGGAETRAPIDYVALGDSIAFGLGSVNGVGYPHHLREYIASTHPAGGVGLYRRAVPGARSQDLLSLLQNDDLLGTRALVRDAEIVTVSIGGNNLLRCASDDYRSFDLPCAAQNTQRFETDWPEILEELRRRIGAQGRLYVLTVYNPFPGDDAGFAVADPFIRRVNAAIADPARQAAYGYEVIDVHTAFSGRNAATGQWNVCAYTNFCAPQPDVHPSDAGHVEIARLHQRYYP